MPLKKDSKLFMGNPNLKAPGVQQEFTKEQLQEYKKCAEDPVYFVRNYVKLISVDRGIIPFKAYKFQEDMLDTMHKNRFVIGMWSRQIGKSTIVTAYILHAILFNQNYVAAIMANKESTAKEILAKLKLGYEHLPKWMQQGVLEWNKTSVALENGSRCLASATSAAAIRGYTINFLLLDEFAHIDEHIQEEFFNSVYPVISSGKTTKLVIISTPKGMNMFYKLWTDAVNGKNSYVPTKVTWKDVPGRDIRWKNESIANTSEQQFAAEQDCSFLGSVHTLINPNKLQALAYEEPIWQNSQGYRIFEEPKKNHIYVQIVDQSMGVGKDYHAFVVIDVTKLPYKVVATYRNNTISPVVLPTSIVTAAKQYNNAHILCEINTGTDVPTVLQRDMEYENIMILTMRGRAGQKYDSGFGKGQPQIGLRTSELTKRTGCAMLKTLIEENKLYFDSFEIIKELFTFVATNKSYEAEAGHNDDLVMCLVMFGWLVTQDGFKELTNSDIREDIFKEEIELSEVEMTDIPFLIDFGDDHIEKTEKDDDGHLWTPVDDREENSWSF